LRLGLVGQLVVSSIAQLLESRLGQPAGAPEGPSWRVPPLNLGDGVWPVGTKLLEDHVAQYCAGQGIQHLGGMTRAAGPMREELRCQMLIGKSNVIPAGPLRVHATCAECASGVCITRDAKHMPRIAAVAGKIHKHFSGTAIGVAGKFYVLRGRGTRRDFVNFIQKAVCVVGVLWVQCSVQRSRRMLGGSR